MSTVRKRSWANGRRRAEQHAYKRNADQRLKEIEAELQGGIHIPRSQKRLVEEVVPEWLAHKEKLTRMLTRCLPL